MEENIFLTWGQLVTFIVVAFVMSTLGTSYLIKFLANKGVFDTPNQRSNHKAPVPRGGGIAIIGTYLFLFTIICTIGDIIGFMWPVLAGTSLLMFVSLIDDIKPLPAALRLVAQIIATSLVLTQPHVPLFSDNIPVWLDNVLIVVAWVWFINMFNFMDGIDGITCSQTSIICICIALLPFFSIFPPEIGVLTLILGVCSISFLFFNWHPAKIFLGDVGSIPLGYLVGWNLLLLVSYGYWVAALILPAYYFADSGITLLRRIIKREKIWEAHSQHFYQVAVRAGRSHSSVVLLIIFVNIFLATLAILSIIHQNYSLLFLAIATIMVILLILKLRSNTKKSE